jgi:hypothetical protein
VPLLLHEEPDRLHEFGDTHSPRAIEPCITELGRNNQFWLVPEALGVLVEGLISP